MKIGDNADLFTAAQANAYFQRGQHETRIYKPVERLASGYRVNRASDDASSLAIANRMATEFRALEQGALNAGRTASALQIADGAMAEMNGALVRMRVLAVAAGSGNLSNAERALLDTEFQNLKTEVQRIADDTTFAGKHILRSEDVPEFAIPFASIGLLAKVTAASINNLGGANPLISGDAVANEGEAFELVFQYETTEPLTGVSYDNARLTNLAVGGETGDVVGGVTLPGNATSRPGDGLIFNPDDTLPNSPANVLVTLPAGTDLDIAFRDGTEGLETNLSLEFSFTDSSGPQTVDLTFGPFIVGALSDGQVIPVIAIEPPGGFVEDPGDRDVSARVGSGIIEDEDDLRAIIPDVTVDDLNAALPGADIRTKDAADDAIGIVDSAIDALTRSRATVGALMQKAEAAADTNRFVVELKNMAHANLLMADIAREATNLANGVTGRVGATETWVRFTEFQRAFSNAVVGMLDRFN